MKKWFIPLIICISSFIIYTNNVNAAVYSVTRHFTDNYIICQSGYGSCTENLSNAFGAYASSGMITGTIYFNFVADPQIILNQVSLNNSGGWFPCNLGTQTIYDDNKTGYILYSATCPISIISQGITQIKFTYDDSYLNQNSFKFFMGDYYSFYQDLNDNDYTSLLNTINSNLVTINNTMGGKLDLTYGLITNIYNQVTNSNTKLEDIKSKLDSLNTASSNISNNTQEIKDKINDSSIDNNNATSSASSWSNKNATNGTITNLLTLPISLLQNILNGIQTSCSSFSLGTLFNTELILPCINLSDLIGSTLFNVIDLLFSGFMILNIAKKLIKIFNDFTNLKSNQIDEIYSNGGGAS